MTEPTVRQLAVLCAWIECGDMETAAAQLGITVSTVRNTLAAVREVFGVRYSAQAFALAVSLGLIDTHDLRIAAAA